MKNALHFMRFALLWLITSPLRFRRFNPITQGIILAIPVIFAFRYFVALETEDWEPIEAYATPPGECDYKSPDLIYRDVYSPNIKNLDLHFKGAELIGALCYQNITDAVESFHPLLPKHFLLGLAMQESGAKEFVDNPGSSVQGLIHTTDGTAKDFGLKVLPSIRIREYYEVYGHDPAISNQDGRFNPVLNFDAIARMLSCWSTIDWKELRGHNLSPLERALWRLRSLSVNFITFKSYRNSIVGYVEDFKNPEKILEAKKRFKKHNPNLLIDGKPADVEDFIEAMRARNASFGLREYIKFLGDKAKLEHPEAFGETIQREQILFPFFIFQI